MYFSYNVKFRKISLISFLILFSLHQPSPILSQSPGPESELEVQLAYDGLVRITKALGRGAKQALKAMWEHPAKSACFVTVSAITGTLPLQTQRAIRGILVGALITDIITNEQLQNDLTGKSPDEGFEILIAHGGYILTNMIAHQALGAVTSSAYSASAARMAPFVKGLIPQGTFRFNPIKNYHLGGNINFEGQSTIALVRPVNDESVRVIACQWAKGNQPQVITGIFPKTAVSKGNFNTAQLGLADTSIPLPGRIPSTNPPISPGSSSVFSIPNPFDVSSGSQFTPEQKTKYQTILGMLRQYEQKQATESKYHVENKPPKPDPSFHGYRHYLSKKLKESLMKTPVNSANTELAQKIFEDFDDDAIFMGVGDRNVLRECILRNKQDLTKIESLIIDLLTPDYFTEDSDSSLKRLLVDGFNPDGGQDNAHGAYFEFIADLAFQARGWDRTAFGQFYPKILSEKDSFPGSGKTVEKKDIDLVYEQTTSEGNPVTLMVEVKAKNYNHYSEKQLTEEFMKAIFIKKMIADMEGAQFLFYSHHPIPEYLKDLMDGSQILYTDSPSGIYTPEDSFNIGKISPQQRKACNDAGFIPAQTYYEDSPRITGNVGAGSIPTHEPGTSSGHSSQTSKEQESYEQDKTVSPESTYVFGMGMPQYSSQQIPNLEFEQPMPQFASTREQNLQESETKAEALRRKFQEHLKERSQETSLRRDPEQAYAPPFQSSIHGCNEFSFSNGMSATFHGGASYNNDNSQGKGKIGWFGGATVVFAGGSLGTTSGELVSIILGGTITVTLLATAGYAGYLAFDMLQKWDAPDLEGYPDLELINTDVNDDSLAELQDKILYNQKYFDAIKHCAYIDKEALRKPFFNINGYVVPFWLYDKKNKSDRERYIKFFETPEQKQLKDLGIPVRIDIIPVEKIRMVLNALKGFLERRQFELASISIGKIAHIVKWDKQTLEIMKERTHEALECITRATEFFTTALNNCSKGKEEDFTARYYKERLDLVYLYLYLDAIREKYHQRMLDLDKATLRHREEALKEILKSQKDRGDAHITNIQEAWIDQRKQAFEKTHEDDYPMSYHHLSLRPQVRDILENLHCNVDGLTLFYGTAIQKRLLEEIQAIIKQAISICTDQVTKGDNMTSLQALGKAILVLADESAYYNSLGLISQSLLLNNALYALVTYASSLHKHSNDTYPSPGADFIVEALRKAAVALTFLIAQSIPEFSDTYITSKKEQEWNKLTESLCKSLSPAFGDVNKGYTTKVGYQDIQGKRVVMSTFDLDRPLRGLTHIIQGALGELKYQTSKQVESLRACIDLKVCNKRLTNSDQAEVIRSTPLSVLLIKLQNIFQIAQAASAKEHISQSDVIQAIIPNTALLEELEVAYLG